MNTLNDAASALIIENQIKAHLASIDLSIAILPTGGSMLYTDYLVTHSQNNIAPPVVPAKPIYSTTSIIAQLTTSWGGGDTSTHLWGASANALNTTTPKAIISFGISTSNPTNFSAFGLPLPLEGTGLVTMTSLQVASARLAFKLWDDLIASSLVESGGAGANVTLNYSSVTGGSDAYSGAIVYNATPHQNIVADQIWLGSTAANNANSGMANGGYGLYTMVHEIGHSLGLSHPALYNGSASYATDAVFSIDNRQYTVMSYFGGYDTIANAWTQDGSAASYKYPQTPMVYDIAAIQSLYGADMTTRTGDTIYGYNNNFAISDPEKSIFDFSINTIPIFTIWDAGGTNDALDCSGWAGNQIIDLTAGNYSSVRGLNNNVGIAFNTIIEKAVGGTGNDKLIGNAADNILNGGAGADAMLGGAGNDTYYVDNVGDVVTEALGMGVDTVYSSVGYTLAANVENLVLTGTTIIGLGNELDNQLTGNSANNILGGGAGTDTMMGGAGNDTYFVDVTSDAVIENLNEGTDIVYSTATNYTLSANVENLIIWGDGVNGTGNAQSNYIFGGYNSASTTDNSLDGGAGADFLIGFGGNDTYYVDNVGDLVIESANQGLSDTVYSSVSYTLTANVENLILTGTAINGFGNELNNRLTGDSANNILGAGAGTDTMIGGAGNDTYFVDVTSDAVIENLNEGADMVYSTASYYTLSANVENLVIWGAGVNGTGNADNNYIFGGYDNTSTTNNILDGGAGDDILMGFGGQDTYIGGLGQDTCNLTEITAATDTVCIATGDSLPTMGAYDVAIGFKLGTGVLNTTGVDKLDLASTHIAANATAVNGINSGSILSNSISNGIIRFDDIDNYTAPLAITATNLADVFGYLQANITGNNAVAFVAGADTYVFQDGGVIDTLVELVGVMASSVNNTGLATNSVWLV